LLAGSPRTAQSALFWEARLWRIAELLPTDKKLHLRPPARPVQHGFNLGASGGAIRGPRHSSLCGDAVTGLVREPFISEADNILDVLAEHIPNAADEFKIIFSASPFPGCTARFVWTRAEYGGNWYRWPEREMEGWLCPALLKYFESSPKEIFVQACAKSS
jgi:hypothetical protein